MSGSEIIVIEDDRKTADLIRLYLEREGHSVRVAADGRSGLAMAENGRPAAIVLDLMLPGLDGLDICHALRQSSDDTGVPILMLTARSTEDDLILGLEVGADDYMTKPFSPRELVARVRALLRRAGDEAPQTAVFGDLSLDHRAREAHLGGELLPLTPAEFDLLAALSSEPGRAFTRQELLDRAFGFLYEGLPRTVDVHILRLRRKLERDPADPHYVLTVRGRGYKFNEGLATAVASEAV